MPDLIRGNVVIGQAGGPTAVINQSLVGVVEGVRMGLGAAGHVERILGMRHGVRGLLKGDLFDLTEMHQDRLDRLAVTPSAALGSTRDKPDEEYCRRILEACEARNIRYFFYIGGNDSADTCRIVSEKAEAAGWGMRCFHVPKTIDNDLRENDHTPGFPSAARFVAMACMADFMDNISLPGVKVNVIMGRNAGFLTAAAALARRQDRPELSTDGPQLIYVPETPFDIDRFIEDVQRVYDEKGRCHLAVSEGVRNAEGTEVAIELAIRQGKPVEYDDHNNAQLSGSGILGDMLADEIRARVRPTRGGKVRVRADTFGYIQRCWPDPSPIDQQEARRSGRYAAQMAMAGHSGGSVAIVREQDAPYVSSFRRVELAAVAREARSMPPEFLEGHCNVSRRFVEWCLPLVGELPPFERL
jgi:6-phosphofructokinase 1